MSNCNVTLYGAVPEKVGDKELVSLTGSASVLNFYGNRILVDIGLFQGGEGSDLYNKENIKFIDDLDAVFITHSHIDHIGRLPLLHKLGYRGPIYMTNATKYITKEMLDDCLKIQEGDAIVRERKNKTLASRLEKSLELLSELKSELKSKKKLDDISEKSLTELENYLNFYGVKNKEDIEGVINQLKQTLFDKNDIEGVMSQIKVVEYGKEIKFDPKKISYHNNNREDQNILNNFPRKIAEGFKGNIELDKDSERRNLKKRWVIDLINELKILLTDNVLNHRNINGESKKELEKALNFINNDYPNYVKGNEGVHREDKKFYEKEFKKYSDLLKFYDVKNSSDIDILYNFLKEFIFKILQEDAVGIVDNNVDKTIDNLKKLIEMFNLKVSFNTNHIEKALDSLIVLNTKTRNRNNATILFSDAAHLVGSASITITTNLIKSKIIDVLNRKGESVSVFFSGDMGRIKDNRLSRPEIPPKPVDYLQIESTYGGRNHRNREESVKELIDSIEKSEGNVLISVFSQQRAQEILLTLFEEKIKKDVNFLDYEILVDAPLGKKVSDIYTDKEKNADKYNVYDLLTTEGQIKAFGKVIFRFLEEDEWQFVYSEDNKDKKYIILASSGMMEGGAIMNHLPNILIDPKATLLAPGYLSRGTLGNQIVWGEKSSVKINGISYDINCLKKFIDGFSSHIGHDEILQYIEESLVAGKLKYGSTIALTHGNKEGQLELKDDIENILKRLNRQDIIVTIPGLFEEYDIITKNFGDSEIQSDDENYKENRKSTKNSSEQVKSKKSIPIEKLVYKKPIVPRLILDLEKKEEKLEQEKIPQVVIEEHTRNQNEINQIKSKRSIISLRKESFEEKYLEKLLFNNLNKNITKFISKLSKLSSSQKKSFYEEITNKLIKNETIDKHVSNLWKKITSISYIKDNLTSFIETTKSEISRKLEINIEIDELKKLIDKSEQERVRLKSKLSSLLDSEGEKDDEYRKKIADLKKKIKSKNNKIKHERNSIKNLEVELDSIKNELTSYVPHTYLSDLDSIYSDILSVSSEKIEQRLLEFCKKVIDDYQDDINRGLKQQKSYESFNFKKSKPNFEGRNLYKELYDIELKQIDLNKLQVLIDNGFFSEEELTSISNSLVILKSSDSKKKKKSHSMNNLISYFKKKRDYNNDLGVDTKFSIEKLNDNCLSVLGQIFEEEYFEKEIKDKFNIYLFLKSKQSLTEYISSKYILLNLKGISDYLSEFDKKEEQIDYLMRVLDILEQSNYNTKSVDELAEINFGIYSTRIEIENILKMV